jgi:hypothetical protein
MRHLNQMTIWHPFSVTSVSRGSSVSIVSGYELDDRAIGVRFPAKAKDFSSNLSVQTCSGAHPASCTIGTGGSFPGAKRGRGVTLTTHSYLVPRSMSRSYTSCPPQVPPWRVAGVLFSVTSILKLHFHLHQSKSVPFPEGSLSGVLYALLIPTMNATCLDPNISPTYWP